MVPWVSLQFVTVAYPDHTHLLHISDGNVMIYLCSTSFVVKLKMSQNFRQRNEKLNSQFSKCGLISVINGLNHPFTGNAYTWVKTFSDLMHHDLCKLKQKKNRRIKSNLL